MILDFRTGEERKPSAQEKPEGLESLPAETPPPDNPVQIKHEPWDACKHHRVEIDEKQSTVQCVDCKMWVNPVYYIMVLYRQYEQRVDRRVQEIREFEERQKKLAEKKKIRKARPREYLVESFRETMERALYNEYTAKRLEIRAKHQRIRAEKLDAEIQAIDGAQAPMDTKTSSDVSD